jgi:uncharacterized membrane protein
MSACIESLIALAVYCYCTQLGPLSTKTLIRKLVCRFQGSLTILTRDQVLNSYELKGVNFGHK